MLEEEERTAINMNDTNTDLPHLLVHPLGRANREYAEKVAQSRENDTWGSSCVQALPCKGKPTIYTITHETNYRR